MEAMQITDFTTAILIYWTIPAIFFIAGLVLINNKANSKIKN